MKKTTKIQHEKIETIKGAKTAVVPMLADCGKATRETKGLVGFPAENGVPPYNKIHV